MSTLDPTGQAGVDPLQLSIQKVLSPAQSFDPGQSADFLAAFNQAMNEIAKSRAGIQQLQQLQQQRIHDNFNLGQTHLTDQRTQTLSDLADRLASQGILRSGINVHAQGDVQKNFADALQNLGLTQQRGLEDLGQNVSASEQALLNREQELNIQKAAFDRQQALAAAQAQAAAQAPGGVPGSTSPAGYSDTGQFVPPSGDVPLGGYVPGIGGVTSTTPAAGFNPDSGHHHQTNHVVTVPTDPNAGRAGITTDNGPGDFNFLNPAPAPGPIPGHGTLPDLSPSGGYNLGTSPGVVGPNNSFISAAQRRVSSPDQYKSKPTRGAY